MRKNVTEKTRKQILKICHYKKYECKKDEEVKLAVQTVSSRDVGLATRKKSLKGYLKNVLLIDGVVYRMEITFDEVVSMLDLRYLNPFLTFVNHHLEFMK